MKFRDLIVALALAGTAIAQEIPASNPAEVWVKGRKVDHSWRDGKIWVPASQLQPLLNLSNPAPAVDLLEALNLKGGYVWSIGNGKFEARLDPNRFSQSSPGAPSTSAPRVRGSSSTKTSPGMAQPGASGNLEYVVQDFTADTGFVRSYIMVTNTGSGRSDPSEMVCQFKDGLGQTYASTKTTLPSLKPGESHLAEAFSMVEAKHTSFTPTTDNMTVNFFSLTDPSKNPKTRGEARKQAKKSLKRGTDFDVNRGYGDVNRVPVRRP